MAVNRTDLDLMAARGCQEPGCDGDHSHTIFLHPRCHMSAGTWASYTTGTGELVITCKECKREVGRVKVADE